MHYSLIIIIPLLYLHLSDIENAALAGPSGGRISTWVISVPLANINTVFNITALNQQGGNINLIYNHDYTFYFVAADGGGNLQAAPVRIFSPTLPCPPIKISTFFGSIGTCINTGATGLYSPSTIPFTASGILQGTTWNVVWGDGATWSYTSASDGDIPSAQLHTYTSVSSCNYVGTWAIVNPCGQPLNGSSVFSVHGRDIPSDGDGALQIVNNTGGSPVVQVCAGTLTTVTLRDNSKWNCQNPSVPGYTPVPNNSARQIAWQYGQDPTGAPFSTITGVTVAGLGAAPTTSGRITPSPYGAASLSQAITIPATCVAGQYFRVYLEYWNQECNWADAAYVDTFVDIQVITAPPAPTASSSTICSGGDRTLTVSSTPVGTLKWYSDAGLSIPAVGTFPTATTFVQTATAAGVYNYWVVDQSATGLMCMSPSTEVVNGQSIANHYSWSESLRMSGNYNCKSFIQCHF